MKHVTSWRTRIKQTARGELFNPLVYPFLMVTLAYGVGFAVFGHTAAVAKSSLFASMALIAPWIPFIWGCVAVAVIVLGFYVLVMDKPPIGKANCLVAWMLWLFASIIYIMAGAWLTVFAVSVPSLWFWTWQYFSLGRFRREDKLDKATMIAYDSGQYDDELNPKDSRYSREHNRGVDTADRDSRS